MMATQFLTETGPIPWHQFYRCLLQVIPTRYYHFTSREQISRQGLYPAKSYPTILGKETAGIIVKLPTDETLLNDEEYKKRGYVVGGTVAVVRFNRFALLITGSNATRHRISLAVMPTTYPYRTRQSILSLPPFRP
jgi:hypothetical protein